MLYTVPSSDIEFDEDLRKELQQDLELTQEISFQGGEQDSYYVSDC